jgi:hypothetical protein
MIQSEENPEFKEVCGLCGFALHTCEIAADIKGEYTDFFDKSHGSVNVVMCKECWDKLQETNNAQMRTAIARRRAFENQDKSDKKDIEER